MEKKVHIWLVKCKFCGYEFKHIFTARDILRPHIFNDLDFTCPQCGRTGYDPVRSLGKQTLQEWQNEHPDLDIKQLPDYDYNDDSGTTST